MEEIEFICMANSRKYAGRCVAGIRTDGKGWIRPVSSFAEGALDPVRIALPRAGPPQALDHLAVTLSSAQPSPHQPENWIAADRPWRPWRPWRSWRLVSRPAGDSAIPLLFGQLVRGPHLFRDTADRIAHAAFIKTPAAASLALVVVNFLEWHIITRGAKRKNRVFFTLGGQVYNLGLTDPVWEEKLAALPPGRYTKEALGLRRDDKQFLTISLGEPFRDGCCYKLVAAVIPVPPAWRTHF